VLGVQNIIMHVLTMCLLVSAYMWVEIQKER
jgi:hypothetical protein